jgi:hypothetical protein
MDSIIDLVSKNTGIPRNQLTLYTLTNDSSDNPDDFYFADLEQYAGYAVKTATKDQYIFTIGANGYRDLLIFSEK